MEKLDEEQIADFKAAFSMFDKDGSGDVSTEELGAVLKELGQEVSKSQLEIMIKEVDADGSGSVEFPEFCSMMASLLGLGGASDDPFGSGGSVFKDLAKDMHDRIGQAKAMGIMPGSIDSAENLYRITAFIQKSQDHVGKSYQQTEKANALKERLGKRKKKKKRNARSVAQIRADRSRMSDLEQKQRDEDVARIEKMEEEREVASKLGPRGRFGDGDGSYWDRWLQRGHVRMCDKNGVYSVARNLGGESTFSGGFKEPASGFKRFEPDALLAASASRPIEERDQAARERRAGVSRSTLKHRQRHHAQFEMFRKGGIAAVARHFRESAAEAAARTGVEAKADANNSSGSSADDESDDDDDEEGPDGNDTERGEGEEEQQSGAGGEENRLLAAAGGATLDDDGNLVATRRRPNTEAEKQLAAEAADAALDEVAAPIGAKRGADAGDENDAAEFRSLGKIMARENYFGEDARWNLFDAYKQLAADVAKELPPAGTQQATAAGDEATTSLRGGKLPPLAERIAGAENAAEGGDFADRATQMDHIGDARIHFLSSCHQLGLAPEPLLVRRADVRSLGNAELRLRNRSLGPERIGALSRCMASMPLVKHLDLSGNRVQNGDLPYHRAPPGAAVLGAGHAAARKAASDDILVARTKGLEAGIGKNVGVGQDFVPCGTASATTSQILSTSTITGRLALRSMTREQFNDPDPEDEDAVNEERERQIGAELAPSWVESRLKLPNMSQEGATWHTQVTNVAAVQAARSARKARWQVGLQLEEEKHGQASEHQPDVTDGIAGEGSTDFQPQHRVSAWHDVIGSLRQQPRLLTLSLASNRLPFKHALALASLIGDADGLSALQALDLSGCSLSDQVGKRLGLVVAAHEHLTKVLLDNNQLHTATGRAFREAISAKHNALVHLSMRNNNLSAVAVQELAAPLASNSMLQTLRLDGNNAGDEGACALASALIDAGNKSDVTNPRRMFRCSGLRVLGLADNGIGARGCSALALALRDDGCGGPLQSLILDGNPIGFGAALAMSVTVAEFQPPRAGLVNVSLARANVDLESPPLIVPDAPELPDEGGELDAEAQEEQEKAVARENNIRKIIQSAAGATDIGAETEATGAMRRPELRRGRDGSTGVWDVLAWPLRGPGNYTFELDNVVHLVALDLVLNAVESAPGYRVESCVLGKQKLAFDSAPFELLGDDETVEGTKGIPEAHVRAVAALDRARKTRVAEQREMKVKAEAEQARRIEAGEPPEDAPVDDEDLTEEEREELRQRREEKEEAEKRRWGWLDASSSDSDVQHTVLRRPPELQRANLPDEGELELELAFDHSPVYDELVRPSPEQLKNGAKGCEAAESALHALCRRCANRFSGGGLLRVLTEGLRFNAAQQQRLEKAGEEADWWAERQREKKLLELMGAEASELDRQRYAKYDPEEVKRRAALLPDPKLLKKHDPTFNPLNRLTAPWYVLTKFAEVGASDAVPVAPPAARKAPEAVQWTLEKSVWGERPKQTKGGANPYHDYYDKPPFHCSGAKDARGRLFRTDWRRMAKKPNSKVMMERNIGTSEEEVHEVRDEIARDYDWVCACFDFYCATGTGSAFSMSPNSFKDFLEDCKIPEKRSKFVSPELIDGMFVAVNVEVKDDADAKAENAANDDRQLLRFEFLDILLRIAFAKYLQTGRTNDPSEAVDMLTERNIKPNLDAAAMTHATRNEWRRERMYNEQVCEVLRSRKSSLKALFVKMSRANRKASAEPRMTIDEWCTICDRCGLLDAAFTKREARLAFVSSKFRVVDEVKHRLAWTSISFIDFLELIPRAAEEKIYPTESQLRELIQTSETLVSLYKQLYKFDDATKEDGGTPEGTPDKEKSKERAAKAPEREISPEELVRYCTIFDRWSGHDDFLDAERRAQKDVAEQERIEADRIAKLGALERELDGTHMEEGGAGAGEAAALDAAEFAEDRRWPRQIKIADGVCTITGNDQCLPLADKVQFFLNEIWARFECDHDTIDPGEIEKDSNGVLGV